LTDRAHSSAMRDECEQHLINWRRRERKKNLSTVHGINDMAQSMTEQRTNHEKDIQKI
jgi:hypothetical protein